MPCSLENFLKADSEHWTSLLDLEESLGSLGFNDLAEEVALHKDFFRHLTAKVQSRTGITGEIASPRGYFPLFV